VAKSRLDDIEKEKQIPAFSQAHEDPGPLVRNFAKLGTALDEGKSGAFLQRYDNVPATHVFATLAKVGIMVSRMDAVDRFLTYPGVDKLVSHPKLLAVKNDPEVAALLNNGSFVRLLRHEKVLALATARLRRRLEESLHDDAEVQALLDEVVARRLDPSSAATTILERQDAGPG